MLICIGHSILMVCYPLFFFAYCSLSLYTLIRWRTNWCAFCCIWEYCMFTSIVRSLWMVHIIFWYALDTLFGWSAFVSFVNETYWFALDISVDLGKFPFNELTPVIGMALPWPNLGNRDRVGTLAGQGSAPLSLDALTFGVFFVSYENVLCWFALDTVIGWCTI